MNSILTVCALAASFAAADIFELEFSDNGDLSYGHHGQPAKYKAMEGIVHPWLSGEKSGMNKVVLNPNEELQNFLGWDDLEWTDFDTFGMMDPFGESTEMSKEKAEAKKMPEGLDEDEMAMLTIMESTPSMCPLCAKEGHGLGHHEHKRFLAKLRSKLLKEDDKAGKKKSEPIKAKEMDECPLCRAEGGKMNHETHEAIMMLAKELEFMPSTKKTMPSMEESGCMLCKHEGTQRNHEKHEEILKMIKMKSEMSSQAIYRSQQPYRLGMKRMQKLLDEHRDMMIAATAEAQYSRDRRERVIPAPELALEFIFEEEEPNFGDDLMDMPFDMMKMIRGEPARDFHRLAGEPADNLDDSEDDGEESLWEKIVRNIRDLLGMGESRKMSASMNAEDNASELGGIIAMLLLFFVGLLLVTFGLVELLSVFLGEDKNGYEIVDFDAEERMILEMEDGASSMMDMHHKKGTISI